MRVLTLSVFAMCAATAAFAQQWEFGAVAGGGFLNSVSASGGATAGFAPGLVAGALVGERLSSHISGEIRYEFFQSDLRLSSSGQTARFAGDAHAVHYDILYRVRNTESRVQFYGAVGGGMKIFRGTGAEEAFQPLSQYGYFTKTQEVKPMISAGGGVTFRLASKLMLRAEVRDFITPFPTQVLTPAPDVKFGSFLNDVVPMVALEYVH